jgi:hypothetical protein
LYQSQACRKDDESEILGDFAAQPGWLRGRKPGQDRFWGTLWRECIKSKIRALRSQGSECRNSTARHTGDLYGATLPS